MSLTLPHYGWKAQMRKTSWAEAFIMGFSMNLFFFSCISYGDVDGRSSSPSPTVSWSLPPNINWCLLKEWALWSICGVHFGATPELPTINMWVCCDVSKSCKNENTEILKDDTDRAKWKMKHTLRKKMVWSAGAPQFVLQMFSWKLRVDRIDL